MEFITVEVLHEEFKAVRDKFSTVKYKDVTIRDNFFENDETYKRLKQASHDAYKAWKIYEFNKRNK